MSAWWEYKGKRKPMPKNLKYKKSGGLDLRYKVVRDFLSDKDWVFKDPIGAFYNKIFLRMASQELPFKPKTLDNN